jgi:hypothetical protein
MVREPDHHMLGMINQCVIFLRQGTRGAPSVMGIASNVRHSKMQPPRILYSIGWSIFGLILSGCTETTPGTAGVHYRLDDIEISMPAARAMASKLDAEISRQTGFLAEPIVEIDSGPSSFVQARLSDGIGFEINVRIYPDLRSLILDVKDNRLRLEANSESEARAAELGDVARKIIESSFLNRPMRIGTPSKGVQGP